MEFAKDQPVVSPVYSGGSKLRYPLRSAAKWKENKPVMVDPPSSSVSRRGRAMYVSKSVLDLPGKDNSAKPPRRFSGLEISKSKLSPLPPAIGNVTPISETRTRRSSTQGKSDTPLSDVARASSRKKFSVLSSVSYWLAQIKLSEAASKHSVSLGFFKLALESGCEPTQQMRDELKSYARRHNLVTDLGKPAKELLQSFGILDDLEELKISEVTQSPKDGTHNHDDSRSLKLKPKSLNSENFSTSDVSKKKQSAANSSTPANNQSANSKFQKKATKPNKGEPERANTVARKKRTSMNANTLNPLLDKEQPKSEDELLEDKENMDIELMEGPSHEEVAQTS